MMLVNDQREEIFRESAAENIPPIFLVRVKWCGKSAPVIW